MTNPLRCTECGSSIRAVTFQDSILIICVNLYCEATWNDLGSFQHSRKTDSSKIPPTRTTVLDLFRARFSL